MLSKHERYYGLGMDALVIVFFRKANIIMVWAWMLWSAYALQTRTTLWFECSPYLKVHKPSNLLTAIQNRCLEHSADDFQTL